MTSNAEDLSRLKPMRGFFAMLTPQQQAQILAYRGSDAVAAMPAAAEAPTRSPESKSFTIR